MTNRNGSYKNGGYNGLSERVARVEEILKDHGDILKELRTSVGQLVINESRRNGAEEAIAKNSQDIDSKAKRYAAILAIGMAAITLIQWLIRKAP